MSNSIMQKVDHKQVIMRMLEKVVRRLFLAFAQEKKAEINDEKIFSIYFRDAKWAIRKLSSLCVYEDDLFKVKWKTKSW